MDTVLNTDEKEYLLSVIRDINDFPKPGIIFKDITTLLNDKKAFSFLMDHLVKRYSTMDLDYIAGIDARGFIFGAALAYKLGIGFVPIRKKGKLPNTTICEKYELEYGFDEVEMHLDSFNNQKNVRVVLIDDLIATGGTAFASAKLILDVDAILVESCFILGLSFLEGKKRLENIAPVYSVLDV